MKHSKDTRWELFRAGKMGARAGQSMTALLVGLAIMGCVGAGAVTVSRSSYSQEQELSAKSGAGLLMDSLADEIRKNTRYSEIVAQYDGKTFGESSADDEFIVHTTVRKTCNASPSTNCDATHVDIEIVDKSTGEVVLKQTVTRTYTHYEEPHALSTLGSLVVPEDSIAVRYISDGGRGNSGGYRTTHGYDLKINSAACGWDYKPNNASPRPNGCVACDAPSGIKQYKSGDCTLGTCGDYKKANSAKTGCVDCEKPTGAKQYLTADCSTASCGVGKKANSTHTGCEAITCPSGQVLSGDSCIYPCGAHSSWNGSKCVCAPDYEEETSYNPITGQRTTYCSSVWETCFCPDAECLYYIQRNKKTGETRICNII